MARRFAGLPAAPTLFAYFAKTVGNPAISSLVQVLKVSPPSQKAKQSGKTEAVATKLYPVVAKTPLKESCNE
jgi:hypothetical protein